MKATGPKPEREVIILFNEEDADAQIYIASNSFYRKLRRRGYSPTKEGGRSALFVIPKRALSIRSLRSKREA